MATNDEQPLVPMAETPPPTGIKSSSSSNMTASKPTVIGIYGLPGSGKTTMLKLLRNALTEDHQRFHFIEGSEMIKKFLPQGVLRETLKSQSEEVKLRVRTDAINDIVRMCREDGRSGSSQGTSSSGMGKAR